MFFGKIWLHDATTQRARERYNIGYGVESDGSSLLAILSAGGKRPGFRYFLPA